MCSVGVVVIFVKMYALDDYSYSQMSEIRKKGLEPGWGESRIDRCSLLEDRLKTDLRIFF